MSPVKNRLQHRQNGLFTLKISTRLSTDNLLLILTMLIFGYCFLYVSLPFMLHKSTAIASPRPPQLSENLTKAEQDHKQQRRQSELPQARVEFTRHFMAGHALTIQEKQGK